MAVKSILVGLGACATVAASLGVANAADPVRIRVQWSTAPAHLIPLVAAKKDMLTNNGKTYKLEAIRMRGSGPALTALAAKEIDIGGISYQAYALGVVNARLKLKVIADVLSSGVKGYADVDYWVRKDSGINSIKDLKGKRLGVNALGSGIDAGVRRMMSKNGYKAGKDYSIVEIRFPAQLPALASNKIDMAALLPPFNLIAARKGKYKVLFKLSDAIGPTQTVVWVARGEWVDKNRAALTDFFTDYLKVARYLLDPKNKEDALKVIAAVTKRPAKLYASWVFTQKDWYHDPNARPDVALLQKNIDDFAKWRLIPRTFKVQPEYIDLSIQEEAVKRLAK